MTWLIPRTSGTPLEIRLEPGSRAYILGPNGSGKSALVQHLARQSLGHPVQWISAHRRTWLQSGAISFTPANRKHWAATFRRYETLANSRWLEHEPESKQSAMLFDLVAQDNARARSIASRVDKRDLDGATRLSSETRSPFDTLNELLDLGTLAVTLENSKSEEIVACHRSSRATYDIAKMSDGERSAVILAGSVLTADEGTVFVIDEPERHLHRAIIEPLLSAVFSQRPDCSFVIATHEIALPATDSGSDVLMVRSCTWSGELANEWEVDLLPADSPLPEDLRRAILGARRTLLFVEGTDSSLDCRLYGALFPSISIVPVGNAREVQQTVKGLRETEHVHSIRALGVVDGDDRSAASIEKLARDGVFVLNTSSVEGLYYCSDAIAAVAAHQARALGLDRVDIMASAHREALSALDDGELKTRMAARRSERLVRQRALSRLPGWKSIRSHPDRDISVTVPSPMGDEMRRYRRLVAARDLDGLVGRYPIRESRAFDCIAAELHCRDRSDYCRMVVSRVRDSSSLGDKLRGRLNDLARSINAADR